MKKVKPRLIPSINVVLAERPKIYKIRYAKVIILYDTNSFLMIGFKQGVATSPHQETRFVIQPAILYNIIYIYICIIYYYEVLGRSRRCTQSSACLREYRRKCKFCKDNQNLVEKKLRSNIAWSGDIWIQIVLHRNQYWSWLLMLPISYTSNVVNTLST